MFFSNYQLQFLITLRKMVIPQSQFQSKQIRVGVYNGHETLWTAHNKTIKNGKCQFFGQSFSFTQIPKKLSFMADYEYAKGKWRKLLEIEVSQNQLNSFSFRKNAHQSCDSNITLIWESEINSEEQEGNHQTFFDGERNFDDFCDFEISNTKNINRQMMIYSPKWGSKNMGQYSRPTSEKAISERYDHFDNPHQICIKQVSSKGQKICQGQEIRQKQFDSEQTRESYAFKKTVGAVISPSTLTSTKEYPKKKGNKNRQNSISNNRKLINDNVNYKSAALASCLGIISGLSGAMMSMV